MDNCDKKILAKCVRRENRSNQDARSKNKRCFNSKNYAVSENGANCGAASKKRRCFSSNNYILSSPCLQHNIDLGFIPENENQNTVLEFLGEKIDAHCFEEDLDLGYMVFLEHLKEDGSSYVFEMENPCNNSHIFVKYEGDNESSDGLEHPKNEKYDKRDSQYPMNSVSAEVKKRIDCVEKENCKCHTLGFTYRRNKGSSNSRSDRIGHPSCSFDDDQQNELMVDESYQTFLNHVRMHHDSLVLELENGVVLKYEELESASSGEDLITNKGDILSDGKSDKVDSHDLWDPSIKLHKQRSLRCTKRNSRKSGFTKHDKSDDVMLRTHLPPPVEENEDVVDESYQTFLNHVAVHGDSLIVKFENNVVVKYEEENEVCVASPGFGVNAMFSCSEPELEPLATFLHSGSSIIEVCEDDVDLNISNSLFHDVNFQFKEELTAYLNRPFDQKEYEMLFYEAKTQKRLEKSRDLRSRSVSFSTEQRGLSYLEYYPDLARQIKYSSPHRSLALLRGFFFWLKNLSHEGSFQPWKELPTDYEIVPYADNQCTPNLFSSVVMAKPLQIGTSENFKNESEMQLIEHEAVIMEAGIQPIQIEVPSGVKVDAGTPQIQIDQLEGNKHSVELEPVDVEDLEFHGRSETHPIYISID